MIYGGASAPSLLCLFVFQHLLHPVRKIQRDIRNPSVRAEFTLGESDNCKISCALAFHKLLCLGIMTKTEHGHKRIA